MKFKSKKNNSKIGSGTRKSNNAARSHSVHTDPNLLPVVLFTLQKRRTAFPQSLSFRNYSHLLHARPRSRIKQHFGKSHIQYVHRKKNKMQNIQLCLEVNMHTHTHIQYMWPHFLSIFLDLSIQTKPVFKQNPAEYAWGVVRAYIISLSLFLYSFSVHSFISTLTHAHTRTRQFNCQFPNCSSTRSLLSSRGHRQRT